MMFRRKRPVINIPKSRIETVCDVLSLIVIVATVAVVIVNWQKLPDQIPIHFNIKGEANSYGPKVSLIFLTGVSIANYLVNTMLRRYPHMFNYLKTITEANAYAQYSLARKFVAVVKVETCALLFYAIWICIQVALSGGNTVNTGPLIAMMGLLMLSGVGYSIAALRAP